MTCRLIYLAAIRASRRARALNPEPQSARLAAPDGFKMLKEGQKVGKQLAAPDAVQDGGLGRLNGLGPGS
jgi:hypothetical protein